MYMCNELKGRGKQGFCFFYVLKLNAAPSLNITQRNFDGYDILNELEYPWLSFKERQCILEVTFLVPFSVFDSFCSDYDFLVQELPKAFPMKGMLSVCKTKKI